MYVCRYVSTFYVCSMSIYGCNVVRVYAHAPMFVCMHGPWGRTAAWCRKACALAPQYGLRHQNACKVAAEYHAYFVCACVEPAHTRLQIGPFVRILFKSWASICASSEVNCSQTPAINLPWRHYLSNLLREGGGTIVGLALLLVHLRDQWARISMHLYRDTKSSVTNG